MIASIAILLLFVMSIGQTPDAVDYTGPMDIARISVPSAVVWSEDFGNISEWHIYGLNHTADPDYLLPGNFSLTGGVLRAIGPEWNSAERNSSVIHGSWSFDVDIQDPIDEYHFLIGIAVGQYDPILDTLGEGYYLIFNTPDTGQDRIRISRRTRLTGHVYNWLDLDNYFADDLIGWRNIIVTHDEYEWFYVYLDGDLILRSKDSAIDTSNLFTFHSHAGPAIDNVSVHDNITYDDVAPEWSQPILSQEISLGESFYYDINATDHSGIDQYWIDDTQNFTIDDQGVITNIRDLVVGTYNMRVSVNDTLGHIRAEAFTLTVLGVTTTTTTTATTTTTTTTTTTETTTPPPPIDMTVVLLVAGSAVVTIIVIALIVKSRS